MHSDPTAIEDYIKANRGTYTDQAIREQLIAAGHDPAAVDARLAASPSTRTKSAGRTRGRIYVWSVFWIGAVVILLLVGVLLSVSYNSTVAMRVSLFGLAWLGGYLVLGYFVVRWVSRRAMPSSAIGWVGIVLLAPIALFVVAYGSCAAVSFVTRLGPGG